MRVLIGQSRFSLIQWFGQLSTGIKMLLILSMALMPLGLMALLASRESAQQTRIQHETEARIAAASSARQLDDAFARLTTMLRGIAEETARNPTAQEDCLARLVEIVRLRQSRSQFAVFGPRGQPICKTAGFLPSPGKRILPSETVEARLSSKHKFVRFAVSGGVQGFAAVIEIPVDTLAKLGHPPAIADDYTLELIQQDDRLSLAIPSVGSPTENLIPVQTPILNGQMIVEMRIAATRISASEVLLVLLPIMMWLAGAIIGWMVVDRLLMRPLAELQRAIGAFRIENGPLVLPKLTTPAREIRDLSEAFEKVTTELLGHEAEMAEALTRQTRLTREVHHRVKNNLQVVASLINLHSRSARSEDSIEAYVAIQRRVDALAVVHRNHYAELEENRGVSLRALISEIATNLRASASEPNGLTITLNLAPLSVSQDVAVPVAFMITEMVELAMLCHQSPTVAIILEQTANQGRAFLSTVSPSFSREECRTGLIAERSLRVIGGLSRQLRAPIDFDDSLGRYRIEISYVVGSEIIK